MNITSVNNAISTVAIVSSVRVVRWKTNKNVVSSGVVPLQINSGQFLE